MMSAYEKLLKYVRIMQEKTTIQPKLALVLGSGLGGYAKKMDVREVISYTELEGFPVSTVTGHRGCFLFGYLAGVPVVAMQGRVHYYEGYSMEDVVLPIRLMGMLGAKVLFLTNAAGGIRPDFRPGDLMMLTDHIAVTVPNPLIGPNLEALGTRFPDMSEIYNGRLQNLLREAAKNTHISLQQGVYVQLSGPSYETPAEIRMLRSWGADAVGMSTACEAIAAHHMGMQVCAVSCITNMAAGLSANKLNHEEVQENADQTAEAFERFVTEAIRLIGMI